MNVITIGTDGRLFLEGNPIDGDPLAYLAYKTELDAECSLRTYFRMLEHYGELLRLNDFFPDCLSQYRGCPEQGCLTSGLKHLIFSKTVEMVGFPGEPRLEIYTSLKGYDGSQNCELKFMRLENLLDMPLVMGRLKHVVFGDTVDVFEFDTVYTLFEFIDGIVWALSFTGAPKACEWRR